MDKLSGLKEILALDPKNSFVRYASPWNWLPAAKPMPRWLNSIPCSPNDPDYTAGYFMSAQTLSNVGRTAEAIDRLKAGNIVRCPCG